MPIQLLEKKTILETRPFRVEELKIHIGRAAAEPTEHTFHRLDCPDWVNVLAVTSNKQAVLIRQPRAGSLRDTLEVPGGVVDPHEKDVTMTAMRELEEETGFTSQRILPLGSINPNPAIQNNRCHFFLALNAFPNPYRQHFPDKDEAIEVVLTDCRELDHMVRTGQMDHALTALCVQLAAKYIDIGNRPDSV